MNTLESKQVVELARLLDKFTTPKMEVDGIKAGDLASYILAKLKEVEIEYMFERYEADRETAIGEGHAS